MQTIRTLVRFGFGVQAVAMLGAVFLAVTILAMLSHATSIQGGPMSTYGLMVTLTVIVPLLTVIPAITWWKLKRGKPSARRWAIAASILNLLIFISGMRAWIETPSMSAGPFYVLCGITGTLGLIAFGRSDRTVRRTKSLRVSGDGTSKLTDYAAQGLAVVIIWLSMDLWNRWAGNHNLVPPGFLNFLSQMELAVLITTFAHELGHLAAGWASGKVLRSFQVGPFRWAIRGGAWRFDFNLLRFYSGSVGMVSPDLSNMRSKKAFYVMGGPVASFVLGSVCIMGTLLTPGTAWEPYWMLLSMIANFSIAAFFVNLMPLKPESSYSDGAQLHQIMTNGPWARVHFAFAMVTTSLVSRVRPRDFDVSVLHHAAYSVPNGERGLLLRLFACQHYLDANRTREAIACMEDAEALYDQSVFEKPQDICAEFAFINAFYKRDLAAAELWWSRIEAMRKIEMDADYWRARAGLLWLRSELVEAREAWERGNALAQKLPAAGTYDFVRSGFAKLRSALDVRVEAGPAAMEVREFPRVLEAVGA
jgi:hypothetical protein